MARGGSVATKPSYDLNWSHMPGSGIHGRKTRR